MRWLTPAGVLAAAEPEFREDFGEWLAALGVAAEYEVMLVDHFPLYGLRVTTGDLELRLPDPEELSALADLAYDGVHDPASMPFTFAWTDLPPAQRARSVIQHHWRKLGEWKADAWSLPLTVFRDGEVVGLQAIHAEDFAVTGEVHTGSWLGQAFHGQGIGTRMRAAVLHLAFVGLGAREAATGALDGNEASLRVSAKLGYRPDGVGRYVVRDRMVTNQRLRLSREVWKAHATIDVELAGVTPCRELFGLA